MKKCLNRLLDNGNDDLAFAGSRKHIQNILSFSSSKIYCFDKEESIGSYQISLFMRSDLKLKKKIEGIIQRSLEGGLFVKWQRDNKRHRKYEISYIQPTQMKFEHISMALIIGCIGISIATLTFICELVVHRKNQQYPKSKFWIRINQHLCSYRNYFRSDC